MCIGFDGKCLHYQLSAHVGKTLGLGTILFCKLPAMLGGDKIHQWISPLNILNVQWNAFVESYVLVKCRYNGQATNERDGHQYPWFT